jgi:hypothetical protein
MHEVSLYLVSSLAALWGIAHLFATGGAVSGFGLSAALIARGAWG